MPLPGFTANYAAGAGAGAYRGASLTPASGGVVPQLPIGPVGDGLGTCCCVDFVGWNIAVSSTPARGGLPPWAPAGVTTAGPPFHIGGFRIQCTECPEGYGSGSDCQCSCGDDGTPCAQRDNTTVCES